MVNYLKSEKIFKNETALNIEEYIEGIYSLPRKNPTNSKIYVQKMRTLLGTVGTKSYFKNTLFRGTIDRLAYTTVIIFWKGGVPLLNVPTPIEIFNSCNRALNANSNKTAYAIWCKLLLKPVSE
ncbi:TPA_asm: hypothetical protein [Altiarchaeum virus]|nr:MAG: hypothetical protein BWK75_06445 [Candidatus Altiarchaeales archaeon A3]DAZ85551.1 TPA_asm: hypothetical protein [Altiarchaeum virus]